MFLIRAPSATRPPHLLQGRLAMVAWLWTLWGEATTGAGPIAQVSMVKISLFLQPSRKPLASCPHVCCLHAAAKSTSVLCLRTEFPHPWHPTMHRMPPCNYKEVLICHCVWHVRTRLTFSVSNCCSYTRSFVLIAPLILCRSLATTWGA